MIYNESQEQTIEEGVKFYHNSSEQVFQIDGEAGTGKSVVMFEIARRLNLKPERIMAMAFTGQAAIVMRSKGFIYAKTIHSSLLEAVEVPLVDKAGNIVIDPIFNTPMMTYKFVPIQKIKDIDAMFIDEGWMVPYNMKQIIEKHGIKIFVCGDTGQLPPVADQPAYFISGKVHHLNQLMRQAYDSPLIYLAHRARNNLPIHNGLYGNRVMVIDESELTNDMIINSSVVICGKNRTRDMMNRRVRNEIMGIRRDIPQYGERVICRKNSWNTTLDGISLANGLCGVVTNMPGVSDFDGSTFYIDFMPDLLNQSFQHICCDYKYFNAPYQEKEMIKNSPYSIGEKFESAYALTAYVAQGAEYPNGIYMEEFLSKDIQPNINYTGITRFRNGMIYVKKRNKFF